MSNLWKKAVWLGIIIHIQVIQQVINCVKSLSYTIKGLTYSSIKGSAGNIEYLIRFSTVSEEDTFEKVETVVENAHNNLLKN